MLCNGGPVSSHRPYDHATCLTDLDALRNYFGYERWIIGGHSWGANLALDYATNYPHRVLALIYLAGTGITEDWRPAFEQVQREQAERLPVFAYPPNEEVNREGQRSRLEYLKDPQLVERIRSLNMPALIIQGEKDLRPNWSSEQVSHLLRHAQYSAIPDAEHCLWLTHPQELRKLLRGFLKEILLPAAPSS